MASVENARMSHGPRRRTSVALTRPHELGGRHVVDRRNRRNRRLPRAL
jgi:hypothetical protein